MSYLSALSSAQRAWLGGTLLAAVAIVAVGWALQPDGDARSVPEVTVEMSVRQIAPKVGATGFALLKELGLPRSVAKDRPLAELGVTQDRLAGVAAHLASHRPNSLKYYVYVALCLFGLVFLVRLGRPDGSPGADRKTWYPRAVYVAALMVAVAVAGFALGKSPNPMEGAVKIFKGMVGLQPSIAAVVFGFVFFVVLAVIGNKLVCGWACPFGALQELIYSLPILRRFKRRKVPFWISNTIRAILFAIVLLVLFGVVGGKRGMVLYHPINPFNLFNLRFELPSILATVVVSLLLALGVYRPFCQFICPFGFVSWLFERVSLFRVRVDRARCNECGACSRACPVESAGHKVAGRFVQADCFSCARCLNVCPNEAIAYRSVLGGAPAQEEEVR